MYEEGEGISQDYNMAMKWYQDSADQDDADAQYRIGVLYAQGKGISKNKLQAQQWYQVACNNSNSRSCTAYSKLTLNQ
ncbi:SEL1-like repeat protein [Psychrobacter sp. TAE2020]|nr:SEL1-like repeat protein [Psychrobacter sp. TAE2020]